MNIEHDGLALTVREIGVWAVPTIELSDARRGLRQPVIGTIINAIVDGQRGRDRQHNWKVLIASIIKNERGSQPWNPLDRFAITLGMTFHPGNHGNRPLDAENFIKPILDALAAGLFCDNQTEPMDIEHWNYDDSNFNTLLVHRLDDALNPRDEGTAIAVSSRPGR